MKDSILRNPEQLGRCIRLCRVEKGLSQNALAELIGVGRKWILHLEAGNPKAELALVLRALDALDLQASVGDQRTSSRLDEVFTRLQRPRK